MIKLIIFFLSFNFIFHYSLFANTKEIKLLQECGKVIFIIHAYSPGGGDPASFLLGDCNTQRNLSQQGIDQSYVIGEIFHNYQVPIDQVLSSQWCRCIAVSYTHLTLPTKA